jgi:hypothetical protein
VQPPYENNNLALQGEVVDFSGGQIENVVRKRTVDTALYGKKPGVAALEAYCQEELAGNTQQVIGFTAKAVV